MKLAKQFVYMSCLIVGLICMAIGNLEQATLIFVIALIVNS